jgi:opacity protein-like surface antigen
MGLAIVLLAPTAAQAQDRFFFRPTVGATVGAGPGAVFSTAFGVKADKIYPKLQIVGEGGRMMNIMPSSVANGIEVVAAKVADAKGGKGSSKASASANYGMAGVRYPLREVSGAQTFTEFSVGVARVQSHVSAQIRGSATLQGDISSLVNTPFTAAGTQTKPMVAIGGGMTLGVTKSAAIEMGYRYVRVFTKAPAINMSKVFGGFRFGF